jgi:hypothetical protein
MGYLLLAIRYYCWISPLKDGLAKAVLNFIGVIDPMKTVSTE